MTLQQLEYITAIDTYRHFVTAAEKCFVSQPALTMQVKKLEEELGTLVFDRSKQPIEPTPIGEQIIVQARVVLRESKGIKAITSNEKQSMQGEFKVGVIPTIAPYLLYRFIGGFTNQFPKTKLSIEEIKSEEIIERLKNDSLDIGILSTPLKEPQLREIILYNEPFLFYGQPSHAAHKLKKLTPETLKTNELWLLNQGHCFREQLLNVCSASKKSKHPFNYESGSIESLKNMVKQLGGYTLVPELAVADNDNKYTREFSENIPSREVSLVIHNSFTKEFLLQNLREFIIKGIPQELLLIDKYIRVKWR